jgi:hypothetical protein
VWKLSVHYRDNNRLIHFPLLKHNNAFLTLTLYSFKPRYTVHSIYVKVFQVVVLLSGFHTKSLYVSLLPVTRATCTTNFNPDHLAGSTYVTVLLLLLNSIAMNETNCTHSPQLLLGSERRILHINGSYL